MLTSTQLSLRLHSLISPISLKNSLFLSSLPTSRPHLTKMVSSNTSLWSVFPRILTIYHFPSDVERSFVSTEHLLEPTKGTNSWLLIWHLTAAGLFSTQNVSKPQTNSFPEPSSVKASRSIAPSIKSLKTCANGLQPALRSIQFFQPSTSANLNKSPLKASALT